MSTTPEPSPDGLNRDQAIYMARLSEQAERYEDMVKYMRRIVALAPADELTSEERNLLSVGYKNMMSVRRTSYRVIQQFAEMEADDADSHAQDMLYSEHISNEVFSLIDEVNALVTPYVEAAKDSEVIVFFKKMQGDYNRYGAEISEGNEAKKQHYTDAASGAYVEALEKATSSLPVTNPIRLGLVLNFSVFYYEICGKPEDAVKLAQAGFQDAVDSLDSLPDDEYKDSTLIMQLLRDNLQLWNGSEDSADITVDEVA